MNANVAMAMLTGVSLLGCASTSAQKNNAAPADTPAQEEPASQASPQEAAAPVLALIIMDTAGSAVPGATVKLSHERTAWVEAPAEVLESPPAGIRVMTVVVDQANAAKVANLQSMLALVAAGTEDDPVVSCFVQADPTGRDLRADLQALGTEPQTVSGDVVTLRFHVSKLGALTAAPWVKKVEFPVRVSPR